MRGLEVDGLISVSALATGADLRNALVSLRQRAPAADVGLHLDLIRSGGLVRFLLRDLFLRVPARAVEGAVTGQADALRASGVAITHLDAHRHAYLLPWTRRRVIRAALRTRIPAIRGLRPLDPFAAPQWTERGKRLLLVAASVFSCGAARSRGLLEPHGYVDAATAAAWVRVGALPAWTRGRHIEVIAHPVAGGDDTPSTERGTLDRQRDYAYVCEPPLAQALARLGARVCSFASEPSTWTLPPSNNASST